MSDRMHDPQPDPMLGALIGERYLLTDVLGRGGMGIVYGARDTRLSERPCAVKLVLGTSNDPEEAARFERELHIIARLRSRHVVQVIDAGIMPDRRRYIVMELLEGHTLGTVLRESGPMPVARALPLARGIVAGLAEAHEVGVVHRDLKPANIFVSPTRTGDEVAKVLDFGIAKETFGDSEDLTGRSVLIGTPKYMAPEQFRKKPAEVRTDLYAVGLVLYQMLTGRPPFHQQSPVPDNIAEMPDEFRIGWLHIHQPPAPIDGIGELWPVIERLLSKKPEQRYPDAAALQAALGEVDAGHSRRGVPMITGELSQAESEPSSRTDVPTMGETVPLRAHSSRRTWPLLVAAAALVGLGAWWSLWPADAPPVGPDAAVAELCAHQIISEPPGATVLIDKRAVGVTPYTLQRPCRKAVGVRLERDGYIPAIRTLASGVKAQVLIHLDARAVPIAERPDSGVVDAATAPEQPVVAAGDAPDAAPSAVTKKSRQRPRADLRRPPRPRPVTRPPPTIDEDRPEPTRTPPARKPKPDAGPSSPLFF